MSKARWLVLSEKAFFGRLRFFFSQKTGGPFCPDPLLGRKEGANEIKTYRGGPTLRQTALLFAQRLAKSRARGASGPGRYNDLSRQTVGNCGTQSYGG